ncbi:MAG: OsmC family protein [Dehalococcoidia bacterium]
MYGTLAGALRARKVEFDRDSYSADVEGTIEGPANRTIRITRIHVTYHLAVPAAQRETAERAHQVHAAGCPAHESVKDAIAITSSVEFADA